MKVISFEGFEYSGKSTQIKLLKKYFIKNNIKSTFTREPGGNKDLEKIRNVILKSNFDNLSLIMFFFASRFALLSSIKKNNIIVFDRFFDSTYAYQKYNSKEKKLIISLIKLIHKKKNIHLNYSLINFHNWTIALAYEEKTSLNPEIICC